MTVPLLFYILALILLVAHLVWKCPGWVSLLFVIVGLLVQTLPAVVR